MLGIRPVRPIRLPTFRRPAARAFIRSSRLDWMMLRMLSLNSLAAFTAEVTRSAGIGPQRAGAQAPGAAGPVDGLHHIAAPQKALPAVPPPPQQALPRGSLLDLRV